MGGVAVRATRLVLSCSCTRRQPDRSNREQESAKDYVPHGSPLPHYVAVGARLSNLKVSASPCSRATGPASVPLRPPTEEQDWRLIVDYGHELRPIAECAALT